jgi:2-methylcitrate dehydratase PrpD
MSSGHTRAIAEFIVGLTYEQLTPAVRKAASDVMLDAVGVALAGSRDEASEIAVALAQDEGGNEVATVFGQGFRTSSTMAAWVNGIAVHALDFDASFITMGQPLAGLMPAAFAVAEPLHASGKDLLTAYVAGYEVGAKIARAVPPTMEEMGWHSTATIGTLASAAVASKLLALSVDQTVMALGIASSMACGLVANFGTMTKPLHSGTAARNGVLAAKLARRGYTGTSVGLDTESGFFGTFAHNAPVNMEMMETLGSNFEVERGVRFKAYPCGGLTHTAIDAALALRAEHRPRTEDIAHVDVRVTRGTANRIVFRVPEDGTHGKFCMPYIISRALLDGELTLGTFTDEAVRDPATLALGEKIEMRADPSLDHGATGSRPAVVTITFNDGRTVSQQAEYAKGGANFPLTDAELRAKFHACVAGVLDGETETRVVGMLDDLGSVSDVSEITELIRG